MKTVGVDLRALPADGRPGAGIAHASRELFEALAEQAADFDIRLAGFAPKGAMLPDADEGLFYDLEDSSGSALRKALERHAVDGLLVPSGAVSLGIRKPAFPWVHDLAIFEHPEWFPQHPFKRMLTTHLFSRGLRRAPVIFAISEDTKLAISRILRIDSREIEVTYEGVRPPSSVASLPQELQIRPYILSLGTVEPRKNLEMAARAFLDARVDVSYVIAGQTGWGNVLLPSHERIVRLEDVTQEEKWSLLSNARALLLPSFHEGFGRVALEAMAVGTPVIASDAGAIPEIVRDAGVLLRPDDKKTWTEWIRAALEEPEKLALYAEKGIEQSRLFRWEDTAGMMLAKLAVFC